MNEKQIRYLGVLIALILVFVGYKQNQFSYVWIAIVISIIFGVIADLKKDK